MLKIYGNRRSNNCNKVEYVALLTKTPYEYQEMDFQKDLKTPEYLRIHPAGKVPAIDDDGFVLFESGAIARHLCRKAGSDLYPKDGKQRAIVDQWSDFSTIHIGPHLSRIVGAKVFGPRRGLPVDEKAVKEGEEQLARFLPIVEAQLAKHAFLAGETMTLADLTLFSVLAYAKTAGMDLAAYPKLVAWQGKLQGMEFYRKVHDGQ